MLEKLGCHAFRMNAGGHEVMAPVTEHADNFSGQGFIQDLDCSLAVGGVAFGNCAIFDVLARALAQCFDVGQKWFIGHSFCSCLVSHGVHSSDLIGGRLMVLAAATVSKFTDWEYRIGKLGTGLCVTRVAFVSGSASHYRIAT